jgi:hypothetical protein
MTWIKLDDKTPRHPKIASLSDRAFRWWMKGLCYASEFLTDGVLHPIFWKQVPKADRAQLTGNRLWDWVDPNFLIHDYLHHQTRKEDVEADKERNRLNARAYRERRREERRKNSDASPRVTDDASSERHRPVSDESPTQRTDTHNREQIQRTDTVPPAPARPIISGQANPRDWGRIHGNHVTGFCDWVCLPDFVFEEFRAKSPGPEYVKGWAAKVREKYEGTTIGEDGLKFWRRQWSDSHRTPTAEKPAFSIAEALAREAARKAGKAS